MGVNKYSFSSVTNGYTTVSSTDDYYYTRNTDGYAGVWDFYLYNGTVKVYPKFNMSDLGLSSITSIGSMTLSCSSMSYASSSLSTTQYGSATYTQDLNTSFSGNTITIAIPETSSNGNSNADTADLSIGYSNMSTNTTNPILLIDDEYITCKNSYITATVTAYMEMDLSMRYIIAGSSYINITKAFTGTLNIVPKVTLTLNNVFGYK